MSLEEHKAFMAEAIELSRMAEDNPGMEPFAAIIVKEGKIVGRGINSSKRYLDPTSHGEVEAIRDACLNLRTIDLSGCDLYTTCEPCPLCVATMFISNIRRLYYGASLMQAEEFLGRSEVKQRHYFDIAEMRAQCGLPVESRLMEATQVQGSEAVGVIRSWVASRPYDE